MCSDIPNMPKEANKAKCFVISCFVFSVFSMMGFAYGPPGVVGGLCGILACIGSSILMCCAPTRVEEGNGKFTAASVLLLIAGIIQLIMGILVVAAMVALLSVVNAGDSDSACNGRYSNCDVDSSGTRCMDGVCYKGDPDAFTNAYTTSCSSQSDWTTCKNVSGGVKHAVSGIVAFFFGVAAFFIFTAGILNTLGGVYCLKARAAIQAMLSRGSPSDDPSWQARAYVRHPGLPVQAVPGQPMLAPPISEGLAPASIIPASSDDAGSSKQ